MQTINEIKDHVVGLSKTLTMYFPKLENKEHCWVQNQFRVTENPPRYLSVDDEKLIEITSDTQLKAKFEEVSETYSGGIYLKNILKYQNKP